MAINILNTFLWSIGDPETPAPKCTPGKLQTLHWKNHQSSEDQITYQNGSLVVPQGGDYFVYAQVTYLDHSGVSEEIMYCGKNVSVGIQLEQIIYKKSTRYSSQEIEQLKTTSLLGKKEKWKILYVAGILHLRRNDHVMVKVSDPVLVDARKPGKTFFGAFLI